MIKILDDHVQQKVLIYQIYCKHYTIMFAFTPDISHTDNTTKNKIEYEIKESFIDFWKSLEK